MALLLENTMSKSLNMELAKMVESMIDKQIVEAKDTFLEEVKIILVKKTPLESYARYCEYLIEKANLEHQKEVIHSETIDKV